MFALAFGKDRTGRALGNPVLTTEGRVTVIDGLLACAVLLGLILKRPGFHAVFLLAASPGGGPVGEA